MRAVQSTSEVTRIAALPRRDPRVHEDLCDALTARLTRRHQCHPGCAVIKGKPVHRLNAMQTVALAEAHDTGGLFLQAPPGTGKTLLSALLPRLLQRDRAVLVIPAALRLKTIREIKILSEHWDILAPTIITYNQLSQAKMVDFFDRFRPNLLILDEGHSTKNRKGPRARRIKRYLRDHPEIDCVVVDMSGTGIKRHLADVAHRMTWAMRERCPLPVHESDLVDWGCAVDEKVPPKSRLEAGALTRLCAPEEVGLDGLRRAVGRRIFDTPGAVRRAGADVDASLYVLGVDLPLSVAEDQAFESLRQHWATPDGHPIADMVALWRHARELALGMFYVWDPRPPIDWLRARQDWSAMVRDILANNRRDLDTEFQVADEVRQALRRGAHHEATEVYQAWHQVKDSFVPNTVPRWVGDTAIHAAAAWLQSVEGGGVVWTEHVAFAERLAEVAGVPYFGRQGLCGGKAIEDHLGPCVASIASSGQGRNLQQFSRGWVSSCLPTGTIWDQMLARFYRPGQEADEVEFRVPFSCREQIQGFEQACRDAQMHRDLLGTAVLGLADIAVPDLTRRGWAWREQRTTKKAA